jgi:YidC/Oxa1 family membrane protein insertase
MSLDFLYIAVSWVLLRWHQVFTFLGLSEGSGLNWALSIMFLVITARLLMFRFFIKQVHYQRNMQAMQPRLQEIRKKYKDDRQAQQREIMKLQQEEGFNPLAGCLPMLLQIPIFISLYHVLRHLSNSVGLCDAQQFTNEKLSLYTFSAKETCSAATAKLFGGAPLAGSLRDSTFTIEKVLGGNITTMRVVTIVLVVISAAATFETQRLVKAGNPTPPEGTAATVQKLMFVGIPVSVLFSGLFFPLGVLIYWFTSNIWTMAQQLYINKFHPHVPKEVPTPGQLGKTLAPKPGQKPRRGPAPAPESIASPDGATTESRGSPSPPDGSSPPAGSSRSSGGSSGGAGTDTAGGGGPRQVTPRPGQRPNRPAGGRPSSKRPNRAKKRR